MHYELLCVNYTTTGELSAIFKKEKLPVASLIFCTCGNEISHTYIYAKLPIALNIKKDHNIVINLKF
jgi:hypothetical protein